MLCDQVALRHHARLAGSLPLRGLLPPAPLRALHRVVRSAGRSLKVFDARNSWRGGRLPLYEQHGWLLLQQAVGLLPAWRALARHPALLSRLRLLLDAEPEPDLGSICRVAPPEHHVPATPAHRERDYIAKPPGLWTAWLPLADCSLSQGVLAVSPGSHRNLDTETSWAAASMQLGDVLLFSAETLHRACPNLSPHRPRLSADFRFAPRVG